MASSSGTSRRASLFVVASIAVLAVLVLLLVIYALRSPIVADGGEAPGPAPSWAISSTPRETSTPTATSLPTASAAANPQLMAISDAGSAARATRGSCGTVAPTASISADGGASWTPVSFGSTQVGELLSLRYVSDSQIDMVAKLGSSCALTMLTSFTGGEFWASYPDRVNEAVYFDPAAPSSVSYLGAAVPAPCATPLDVQATGSGMVALCADGVLGYDGTTAAWQQVSSITPTAVAASPAGGELLAVLTTASCDGMGVRALSPSSDPQDGIEVGCLPANPTSPDITIARNAGKVLFWSDDVLFASSDGGNVWTAVS